MTPDQLARISKCPVIGRVDILTPHINATLEEFEITDPWTQAAWIANCCHETQALTRFEENLNYSPERLLQMFPDYFTPEQALKFNRDKVMIARRIYGGRYGNDVDMDGYNFRGRGLGHLTFRDNYEAADSYLKAGIVQNPDKLATDMSLACRSAGWFWRAKKCDEARTFRAVRRKWNGGFNGLDEAGVYFVRAIGVLKGVER